MYFHKEQILKHLKCENCVNDLVNPRVMPCQMILCKNCYFKILLSMNEIDSTIDCICSNVHKIPVDGFPVCGKLNKLVSEDCVEVSRGESADKLKNKLDSFEKILNMYGFERKNRINKIQDYFKNLRNDLQSTRDSIQSKLNQIHAGLFEKILKYETVSLNNLTVKKSEFDRNLNIVVYCNEFINHWTDYLTSHKYDEPELRKAIQEIRKYTAEVTKLSQNIEDTFCSKSIQFQESSFKDNNLLGNVNFDRIKLILEETDIKNELRIGKRKSKNIFIDRLENGSYVLFFCHNSHWKFLTDDLILLPKELQFNESVKKFNILNILAHENYIIINYTLLDGKMYHHVEIRDQDLKSLKSIKLNLEFKITCMGDEKIFALSDSDENRVHAFNLSSLAHTGKFGQATDNKSPFYFPKNLKKLQYSDKVFYCFYDSSIYSMNSVNGITIKQINLQSDHLLIDSEKNLIFISYITNIINYKRPSGEVIRDIELTNFPNKYLLISEKDGYLSFLNLETFEIFEKKFQI